MVFMNDFNIGSWYKDPNGETYEMLDNMGGGLSLQEVLNEETIDYGGCVVVDTVQFMMYFTLYKKPNEITN